MPRQGQQGTGEAPALHPYRKLSRKQEVFPMSNLIPTSQVARSDARTAKPEPIFFDDTRHHFKAIAGFDVGKAVEGFRSPLSVILQITRRCNFNCSFCSEIVQLPDPTLEELDLMRQHLQGVQRVFLSGGEPLFSIIRKVPEEVKKLKEKIYQFDDRFLLEKSCNEMICLVW